MDTETLLKPRWKTIADWPQSPYKLGVIIKPKSDDGQLSYNLFDKWIADFNLNDFPHLFRKLQWWEERSVDEMPEYVKYRERIYKVEFSQIIAEEMWLKLEEFDERKKAFYTEPATFEEYQKQPQKP